jgi:hypothetical protein
LPQLAKGDEQVMSPLEEQIFGAISTIV